MTYRSKIALFALLLTPLASFGQSVERDPFMPFATSTSGSASSSDKKSGLPGDNAITPLMERPLSTYKIIGTVVSAKDALAVIKSADRREFYANVGDKIGVEGGVIEVISSEGITVDINGKITDLIVSNRFDTQNENQ